MSMSLQSARGRRGRRGGPIGDINVTPLVDVMLVLLIVFMVTAPLLTSGVPIDLPQTNAPEMKVEGTKPLTISVTPEGQVYLGEDQITLDTLLTSVAAAAGEAGTQQRLYIRGDAAADYGLIMQVMGDLSRAGYARIGLITQQREP
ncbi:MULTISPECIES: ExbD/TolR family protein [unclassified Devosia]|uniref:ExbD/TolR family protein n=1 Tax=unclassified Devosia TaxID=196773 RepID=UPI00086C50AC|nr:MULTISPECIES: ExbD/TolR family protein [unclassified Devosia]MBN9361044.1 ExbD/TolR family protein [Devosia sp.]ODS97332.1 MAG: protein TolR [Devosia sp. SCN 66-27]OJX22973.1 MAG: protein TolR [Devosia sp. 66-14]